MSICEPLCGFRSRSASARTAMRSKRHSSAPFQTVCTRCARSPSSRPSDASPVSTAASQPWNRARSTRPSSACTAAAPAASPRRTPQGGLVQSKPDATPAGDVASANEPTDTSHNAATPACEAFNRASRTSRASCSRPCNGPRPDSLQRRRPASALAVAAAQSALQSGASCPRHCRKPK